MFADVLRCDMRRDSDLTVTFVLDPRLDRWLYCYEFNLGRILLQDHECSLTQFSHIAMAYNMAPALHNNSFEFLDRLRP